MSDPPQPDLAASPTGTLAERIEWLIRNRWPAGAQEPKTNVEIAAAIQAATGEKISGANFWKLRSGRADNPTLRTIEALSSFFRVPVGFFGEGKEAELIGDQVALLTLLRESGITGTALRSLVDMSPESRQMIAEMIASVARREGQRGGEG